LGVYKVEAAVPLREDVALVLGKLHGAVRQNAVFPRFEAEEMRLILRVEDRHVRHARQATVDLVRCDLHAERGPAFRRAPVQGAPGAVLAGTAQQDALAYVVDMEQLAPALVRAERQG